MLLSVWLCGAQGVIAGASNTTARRCPRPAPRLLQPEMSVRQVVRPLKTMPPSRRYRLWVAGAGPSQLGFSELHCAPGAERRPDGLT